MKDYETLKGDEYKHITREQAYKIFDGLWITPKVYPKPVEKVRSNLINMEVV